MAQFKLITVRLTRIKMDAGSSLTLRGNFHEDFGFQYECTGPGPTRMHATGMQLGKGVFAFRTLLAWNHHHVFVLRFSGNTPTIELGGEGHQITSVTISEEVDIQRTELT